jgi:hypothetical protein
MAKKDLKRLKKGRTQLKLDKNVHKNNKFSRNAQPPNSDQEKPSWQIRILDFEGPWGWDLLDANMLKYIHRKLAQFETMTWAEINKPNTGCHSIKVKDICVEAQKRLAEIKIIDEELFSLRLSGKERLWGIRENHIFKILWWDPKHEVYPVDKKHT